jgi:hypothetical protein
MPEARPAASQQAPKAILLTYGYKHRRGEPETPQRDGTCERQETQSVSARSAIPQYREYHPFTWLSGSSKQPWLSVVVVLPLRGKKSLGGCLRYLGSQSRVAFAPLAEPRLDLTSARSAITPQISEPKVAVSWYHFHALLYRCCARIASPTQSSGDRRCAARVSLLFFPFEPRPSDARLIRPSCNASLSYHLA